LALADALPEKCAELYHLVQSGQQDRAKALQLQLALASKRILSEGSIAGLKYAMDLRGYQGGLPRLPLLPLKEDKKQAIAELMSQLHPAAARV
jgi:4-hydroxy-2-oxoglutarate aldolase